MSSCSWYRKKDRWNKFCLRQRETFLPAARVSNRNSLCVMVLYTQPTPADGAIWWTLPGKVKNVEVEL